MAKLEGEKTLVDILHESCSINPDYPESISLEDAVQFAASVEGICKEIDSWRKMNHSALSWLAYENLKTIFEKNLNRDKK